MGLKLNGLEGSVVKGDIEIGLKQDCSDCPFALSLERLFENFFEIHELIPRKDFHVSVDLDSIEIRIHNLNFDDILIFNDHKVMDWIENFDEGNQVRPVEYVVYERDIDIHGMEDVDLENESLTEFWITLLNYEVINHATQN